MISPRIGIWRVRFVLASAVFVLLVLAYGDGIEQENTASDFFAAALRAAHRSETVSVDGNTYRVDGGAVVDATSDLPIVGYKRFLPLRLAYLAATVRSAPLLSTAGTDPDALDASTSKLADVQRALALLQKTPAERRAVEGGLYPIRFLHALAEVERARQAFLRDVSKENAETYGRAAFHAISEFGVDVSAYKIALTRVAAGPPVIATLNGTYETGSLLSAARAAQSEMYDTRNALARRMACFHGDTGSCVVSDLSLPLIAVPRSVGTNPGSVNRAGEISDLYTKAYGVPFSSQTIYATNGGVCSDTDTDYYVVLPDRSTYPSFAPVQSVSELFLYPDASNDRLFSSFNSYVLSLGVTYVPYKQTTFYHCPIADVVYGRIIGIDRAVRAIRSNEALRKAARKFFDPNARLIADDDVIRFLNYELGANDASLGDAQLQELSELALAIKNNSTGMNAMVAHITATDRSITGMSALGFHEGVGAAYLFMAKAGFPILFALHNPSVIASAPDIFSSSSPPVRMPFLRYSEHRDTISRTEVLRTLRAYADIHTWLETGASVSFDAFMSTRVTSAQTDP